MAKIKKNEPFLYDQTKLLKPKQTPWLYLGLLLIPLIALVIVGYKNDQKKAQQEAMIAADKKAAFEEERESKKQRNLSVDKKQREELMRERMQRRFSGQ